MTPAGRPVSYTTKLRLERVTYQGRRQLVGVAGWLRCAGVVVGLGGGPGSDFGGQGGDAGDVVPDGNEARSG